MTDNNDLTYNRDPVAGTMLQPLTATLSVSIVVKGGARSFEDDRHFAKDCWPKWPRITE